MDWRLKAIAQGTLARLPGGSRLNDVLQKSVGGRRNAGEHIDSKFEEDWIIHMSYLHKLGYNVQGRHLLEVGTGWLPVMPLCFVLAGVSKVTTIDLNRHLQFDSIRPALEHLKVHLEAIAQASGRDHQSVEKCWQALMNEPDGESILRKAGIRYHAPADATRSGLSPASVDIVFSNSVLEHVPTQILDNLMTETRRILKPDGLALHGVNCGDHYAYFDKSITPIHYLRYSDRAWRLWNNDLLYQNRLRPIDFLQSAERAGLSIAMKTHRAKPELLARLPELPIASQFRHYPPEQLCCTSIDFIARPG